MSTIFSWRYEDFNYLLESCDHDPLTQYIFKYFSQQGILLEAGCGSGRYVKYLYDRGYNIVGIEYNKTTVSDVKRLWPKLSIMPGDILSLPFKDDEFSGIISIGVVEHFIEGPYKPLREIYRVLTPGGKALITVPCFNYLRKIKVPVRFITSNLRRNSLMRKLFRKKQLMNNKWHFRGDIFKYRTYPEYGEFYEYRMTPDEFRESLHRCGFKIIEDIPLYHIDGLYHEFGRLFSRHYQWKFKVYFHGKILNWLLYKFPFFHNHMHLCVVTKLH
jgi:SAM-dependent methyltransferase